MAYPANLRGWGPGWPTDRTADMRWVTTQRSATRFQVHHVIAPLIKFICDEVERRGYLLHHPGQVRDDWSYNNRAIRGTSSPSNHSWGLAIDIDATQYPYGQSRRQPPKWIIDLFESYGFEYGGYWSTPDPMHFEYRGSISEARFMVASLAAGHLVGKPAPVPVSTPPPLPVPPQSEEDDMELLRNDPARGGNGAIYGFDGLHYRHLTGPQVAQLTAEGRQVRNVPPLQIWAMASVRKEIK